MHQKTTVNRLLARFALNYKRNEVPEKAWENAKQFFIDALGCMLAGAKEKPSLIAADYAEAYGGKPLCTVLGRKNVKYDPYNAIAINGIAAHIHDMDDVFVSIDGHPSVVVLPAVLAAAELVNATGEETLMAYVTGIEVLKLVGVAFNKNARYYSIGWHATGTLGIFGATAAVGRLMGLDEEQLIYALGIAASESSGLKGNFGTMVKPLHAGRSAAKAFYAVEMARRGYISNPAIMECGEGFAHVTVKSIDLDDMEDALERYVSAFLEPGLSIKPWPCCKQNHSAINAVQNLLRQYAFKPEDVDRVVCLVQPVSWDCLKYTTPETKLQGKFSIQYNVALAILKGDVTLSDYDGAEIDDPEVIALMKRIEMVLDHSLAQGQYNNGKYDSVVKIWLRDGTLLEEWVECAKGDPGNPMTGQEIMKKFDSCISRVLNMERSQPVRDCVLQMEKLASIRELMVCVNEASK